jgi:hypothetical protein
MDKRVLIGLGILALVILAAGGGFMYGTSVGETRARQARQQFGQRWLREQGGQFPSQIPLPGQEGGTPFGGGIMGTIEEIEEGTLVVSSGEGSVRVQTTDTTLIEKYSSVGVEDLEVGEQVRVSGSRNEDDSITARSIQTLRRSQSPQVDQP